MAIAEFNLKGTPNRGVSVSSTVSWEVFERSLRIEGLIKPNEFISRVAVDEHGIRYDIEQKAV